MLPLGVLSVDDTLLTHYGQHFDEIAFLYDAVEDRYTWAHNLVNLHYSDDQTDYPLHFQLWKPADLDKIERGLQAAHIRLRASKFEIKESDPKKWRQYLLGVWSRNQNKPEVAAFYQSKLLIARQLLTRWVDENPALKLPVTFNNWYTQPAFCHFVDQELGRPYVGTLAGDNQVIWPVEVYREEGKAEDLDQYQVRDFQAISRHIGLAAVAYSLLRTTPHTTKLSCTSFNVNSRCISQAAHPSGVGPAKLRACGLWLASPAQD